jgi:hypothetical protein
MTELYLVARMTNRMKTVNDENDDWQFMINDDLGLLMVVMMTDND